MDKEQILLIMSVDEESRVRASSLFWGNSYSFETELAINRASGLRGWQHEIFAASFTGTNKQFRSVSNKLNSGVYYRNILAYFSRREGFEMLT